MTSWRDSSQKSLVYPAPNPDNTFDTHATPTVDGNVLVGPDSQLARDFQDYESTQAAMDGLIESGSRHVQAHGPGLLHPQLCRHPSQAH